MQLFFDLDGKEYFTIGTIGGGTTNSIINDYIAGDTINGNRVVMLDNNTILHADPTDENNYNKIIGISINSGLVGDTIQVISLGKLGSFGSLIPNDTYYLDINGLITNTIPTTGLLLEVGVALTTTILNVKLNHEFITI